MTSIARDPFRLALAITLFISTVGDADEVAGPPTSSLAMIDWYGRPVVELTIDGRGPFAFIVDTGASTSVMDRSLRDELGLSSLGETEIGSPLGGTVPADSLVLSEVRLGSFMARDVQCLGIALSDVLGGGDAPRGVLSTRVFTGRSVTFDYPGGRLEINDALLPPADGLEVFEFSPGEGPPTVPIAIGDYESRAHLDTGAHSSLMLPLDQAKRVPLTSEPVVRGHATLVGSDHTIWGARLDGTLRIGRLSYEDLEVEFLEKAKVGNVGQGILRDLIVTLDHESRRIRLRRGGESGTSTLVSAGQAGDDEPMRRVSTPTGKRRYGIRFPGIDGPELQVLGVDPDSPAALAGVRQGDTIVAMNGEAVSNLDRAERLAALRGSPLTIRVRREDGEHDLELRLD